MAENGEAEKVENMAEDDLILAREAQQILGVSKKKMAELLEKRLTVHEDPLDRRVKLVSRAEVEALRASSTVKKAAA